MATTEIRISILDLPQLRDVVTAAAVVVKARNDGADCWEAKAEIDQLEEALVALQEGVARNSRLVEKKPTRAEQYFGRWPR